MVTADNKVYKHSVHINYKQCICKHRLNNFIILFSCQSWSRAWQRKL